MVLPLPLLHQEPHLDQCLSLETSRLVVLTQYHRSQRYLKTLSQS